MQEEKWPRAFLHADADAFYCGAEKLRHPELASVPVCVLSNNDACIVSKCYRAKAAGIKTGMTVWDAKKILPDAAYLSPDFAFYGQVSDHMFQVFRRFSPEVEQYSIDEAFLNVAGMLSLYGSYQALADQLRAAVLSEVGVTVSVGVAATRTLAKIASEHNKPNGTTVVPPDTLSRFLPGIALDDIPGIAKNRAGTLSALGIGNAWEFAIAPEFLVKGALGKVGAELRLELRGVSVYPLELVPKLPKNIGRTASLGEVTARKEVLAAHLTWHATRVLVELCGKNYVAGRLTVFVRFKSFDAVGADVRLGRPTNDSGVIMQAVLGALEQLYQPGELYRGCGVVASEIGEAGAQTADLFAPAADAGRRPELIRAMQAINRKYGNGSALMLGALPVRRRTREARFRYPMLYVD